MSSKRHLRRKKCERKIRFAAAGAARQRARAIHAAGGDLLNVYPCKFCGGWHIGHPPARVESATADNIRDYAIRRKLDRKQKAA